MFYSKNSFYILASLNTSGIALLLLLLTSCAVREAEQALFYPIDSLLTNQINRLSEVKASLNKTAILGKENSSIQYMPDSTAWKKELEIFHQVNMINKPVNRGLYKVSEKPTQKDNTSLLSFEATEDLPVEYLKVYYDGTSKNVRLLEAKLKEENSMYEATRFLRMTFRSHKNELLISNYSIEGGQKMFLGDSVQYNINATISVSD